MFSHEKKKGSQRIANCLFSMWTSQGLNLGPPDYETNRMIVRDISLL